MARITARDVKGAGYGVRCIENLLRSKRSEAKIRKLGESAVPALQAARVGAGVPSPLPRQAFRRNVLVLARGRVFLILRRKDVREGMGARLERSGQLKKKGPRWSLQMIV